MGVDYDLEMRAPLLNTTWEGGTGRVWMSTAPGVHPTVLVTL